MKTNITIDQRKALAMGLDLVDWILVDWYVHSLPGYIGAVPVEYKDVLEDLPLLPIKSRDAVYRRFKNLVEKGILEGIERPQGTKGTPYYYPGPKMDDLFFDRRRTSDLNPTSGANLGSKSDLTSDTNPTSTSHLGFKSDDGLHLGSKSDEASSPGKTSKNSIFLGQEIERNGENLISKNGNFEKDRVYIYNNSFLDNNTHREGVKGERPEQKKRGSHEFKNSPISTIETFRAAFQETKYQVADLDYYFEAVSSWAESKGARRMDWIAQARNFMIRDLKENKLKTPGSSQASGMNYLATLLHSGQQ
jgi:hypothetical protein